MAKINLMPFLLAKVKVGKGGKKCKECGKPMDKCKCEDESKEEEE